MALTQLALWLAGSIKLSIARRKYTVVPSIFEQKVKNNEHRGNGSSSYPEQQAA
jgi:hypothetical protein